MGVMVVEHRVDRTQALQPDRLAGAATVTSVPSSDVRVTVPYPAYPPDTRG